MSISPGEEYIAAVTHYISTKLWKGVKEIIFFHISTHLTASTHLVLILILSFTLNHCVKAWLWHCATLQHKIRGNSWVSSDCFTS